LNNLLPSPPLYALPSAYYYHHSQPLPKFQHSVSDRKAVFLTSPQRDFPPPRSFFSFLFVEKNPSLPSYVKKSARFLFPNSPFPPYTSRSRGCQVLRCRISRPCLPVPRTDLGYFSYPPPLPRAELRRFSLLCHLPFSRLLLLRVSTVRPRSTFNVTFRLDSSSCDLVVGPAFTTRYNLRRFFIYDSGRPLILRTQTHYQGNPPIRARLLCTFQFPMRGETRSTYIFKKLTLALSSPAHDLLGRRRTREERLAQHLARNGPPFPLTPLFDFSVFQFKMPVPSPSDPPSYESL